MPAPAALWKTAALLYAIAIPGHIVGGVKLVHPLLRKIPVTKREDKIGQRSAQNCYNYVNVSLALAALLSWQWAKTRGPQTSEERIIYWLLLVTHFVYGFRYIQAGENKAVSVMWLAPVLKLVAYSME